MYQIVQQEVFAFIKGLNTNKDSAYSKYMKDAMFIIPTPLLLEKVVTGVSELPLKDRDLKGDIYEYMLGKIQTLADRLALNGQVKKKFSEFLPHISQCNLAARNDADYNPSTRIVFSTDDYECH